MSDTRMVRYLPVQVAGQTYSIMMSSVLAVQSLADTGTVEDDSVEDALPVVDLGVMFGDTTQTSENRHAVIVTTPAGNCALVVDAIRAIVSVETDDAYRLPYLVALTGCPFHSIVSTLETMLPVIDVTRLLEHVRAVRPDLVAEANHAG